MANPSLFLSDLRGGLNTTDPPFALASDQVVRAENIDWSRGTLGGRRLGHRAVDAPQDHKTVFLHRHLPTADETASELWSMTVSGSTGLLTRTTTTHNAVTISGATALATSEGQYAIRAQSLHGKLFLAYPTASGTDRLHVWDGTSVRVTGLAEPAAPSVANQGSGSLTGSVYYRVRYTEQVSSVTVRRSEPSDSVLHARSGSGTATRVTKPAAISEGETHWEVEASVDNVNFYVVATVAVGTTTYDDTSTTTAITADETRLSPDIGDYTLLHNPKFLSADQDRLLLAGSWEQPALGSRIAWTPVFGADGVGNDERFEDDTDPYLDLDGYDGGEITDFAGPVWGYHWAFKAQRIYKIVRRNTRAQAYEAVPMSDASGAIPRSVVKGLDEAGRPCLYYLDPFKGPSRVGAGGVETCGEDIRPTWETLNLDAALPAHGIFDADKSQVRWWIATGASTTPDTCIEFNVLEGARSAEGVRKGWAIHTGAYAATLCAVNYADNYASLPSSRSRRLKPFLGTAITDATLVESRYGTTDNGTPYQATVTTKPMLLNGLLQKAGATSVTVMAPASEAVIDVTLTPDYRPARAATRSFGLAPSSEGEARVIVYDDALVISEAKVLQVTYGDGAPASADWVLDAISVSMRAEETLG